MQTYNIYLFGEITYESAQSVIEQIDTANEKKEYSEIRSFGGFNLPTFALYEKIASSPKPITVKATGSCQSSAVVVLQAGHKRIATEKTFFMLHQIGSAIERPIYSEIIKEADQLKKEYDMLIELTTNKSKLTREEFEKQTQNTFYLTAQEALSYGLIDEIVK